MKGNEHHLIAYEGWKILLFLAFLSLLGTIYTGWLAGLLLFLLFTSISFIHRNPQRIIPSNPLAVVSPASGTARSIETVEDEWLSRTAIRFRMKVSIWNVHILRCPVEGKVMKQWAAEEREVKGFNRRYTYWIKTDEGDDIVLSLILGNWSPFTRVFFITGERLGQGQSCGFLYYTGIIEILMPANTRIHIKIGDRLESGTDVLGNIVHEEGSSVMGH